ncbi:glutamate--tRNA ligase [candidate division KSB1 bacterium]|nr:glutamate--tRNA ligase [candidate division KSB1 bacterium]
MKEIRVRIAPSPTGYFHVGTARTAIFNFLYARAKGGKSILRIEDTNLEKSSQEMVDIILECLKWLKIDWDEGPYYQSKRFDLYPPYVEKLLKEKKAYRCFCTPEELDSKREEAQKNKQNYTYDRACRDLSEDEVRANLKAGKKFTVRIKLPTGGEAKFTDEVYGDLTKQYEELDDFIIVRTDGSPIYNFAVVIDDIDMKISHIIRGNDHIANTFKQIEIYKALDEPLPVFTHLPLILRPDRSKVSKRKGDKSVTEYRDEGYLPEALLNSLALLGWSPKDGREIMTMEEMLEAFDFSGINPNNCIFDPVKLTWMNSQYLMALDNHTLVQLIAPFLIKDDLATKYWIETRWQWLMRVVENLKERCGTLQEFADNGSYFFKGDFEYDPKGVKKRFMADGLADKLEEVRLEFSKDYELKKDTAENIVREKAEKFGLNPADLIHPIRLALTGRTGGPGLFEIVELVGHPEVDKRLTRAIEYIRSLS